MASKWGVSLEKATRTLQATTQRSVRSALDPLHRRFQTKQQQFRYNRLNSQFYSDTMFSGTKSLSGNTGAQVFVNDLGFSMVVPMTSKSMAYKALGDLFENFGVPTLLHTDGAKELTLGKWREVREKQGGIHQSIVEPRFASSRNQFDA
jgi:hypothetical protein